MPSPSSLRNLVPPDSPVDLTSVPSETPSAQNKPPVCPDCAWRNFPLVGSLPTLSFASVTVPSDTVPTLTVDPSVMIKKGALVAGAALKMIELPSIANPSDG